MPFNRDQSTAIRRKGREPPRVARASSAANLQVNALLGNFQGQVDNIMRSLTDQLEQEDAHDAGAAPVGPTEYAMATSSGHKDEHEDDTYQPPYQPPSAVRRLLLIDKQVSPHGHLANAALDTVTVVKYDSEDTTLEELLELIRFAHRKQGFPFTSIACAQHGPDEEGLWIWTSDLVVDLGGGSPLSPITQLTPIVEALGMALEKTRMGEAHIDFLACGLAGFAPRLVLGLEKLYGIDFRASTDDTGNDVNGGDWKMETDNDYDVANDYLDRIKLVAYTEKMNPIKSLLGWKKSTESKAKAQNEANRRMQGMMEVVPQGPFREGAHTSKEQRKAMAAAQKRGEPYLVGVSAEPLVGGVAKILLRTVRTGTDEGGEAQKVSHFKKGSVCMRKSGGVKAQEVTVRVMYGPDGTLLREDDQEETSIREEYVSPLMGHVALLDTKKKLFVHDPKPTDVVQGKFENCYLLGALAAVAAHDNGKLIRAMFPDSAKQTRGSYATTVRFWRKKEAAVGQDGVVLPAVFTPEPVIIRQTLLSRMATAGKHKKGPAERACCESNELVHQPEPWAALVEKAFVVVDAGTYNVMNERRFIMTKASSMFQKLLGVAEHEMMFEGAEAFKGDILEELKRIIKSGAIVQASTKSNPTKRATEQKTRMKLMDPKLKNVETTSAGLVWGHGYAILGLDGEENGPTKLLYAKLYNPWGKLGRTKYDEDDKFGIDPTNPISYVRLDDLADACSKIRYANGPFPA